MQFLCRKFIFRKNGRAVEVLWPSVLRHLDSTPPTCAMYGAWTVLSARMAAPAANSPGLSFQGLGVPMF